MSNGAISLRQTAPGKPESFEQALERDKFEHKKRLANHLTWLFSLSNIVVLIAVAIVYYNDLRLADPSQRLITSEVIMTLIGATTVQLGAIMLTMAKSIFPTR